MALIHPMAITFCRLRLRGQTSTQDDTSRDVATRTLERLRDDDYAALRRYQETRERYPALNFASWLRVVVGNVCIDTLRRQPESQRVRDGGGRQHKVQQVIALHAEPAGRDDLLRRVEIRRILNWLVDPSFPADQGLALSLWIRGHDASEIASQLSLPSAADATRLLRAGRQRLRRQFEDRT
jgi:predicted RNA polymerase sigma factor